jgi:non-specific serine/threonine protein kinase
LRYLAELLSTPGRSVPAIDLLLLDRNPGDVPPVEHDRFTVNGRGEADPILDAEARAAYRARLIELQEDVDAAGAGDSERTSQARAEMQVLARELATAIGLGGRPRDHITDAERARQSATKAIRSAVSRITAQDRRLGVHLTHAVRTGALCAYAPDPRVPLRWVVSLGATAPDHPARAG